MSLGKMIHRYRRRVTPEEVGGLSPRELPVWGRTVSTGVRPVPTPGPSALVAAVAGRIFLGMSRRGSLVALSAIAAGMAVAWVMLGNDVREPSGVDVGLVLAVGWSFVASGLVSWELRPDNHIGPAMIVTGFLRFAAALSWSQAPLIYSIGDSLTPAFLVSLAYMLLAFPVGRLVTATERWLFGMLVVAGGPLHIAWLMFGATDQPGYCASCPEYVFQLVSDTSVASALEVTHGLIGMIAGAVAVGVLVHRWRGASAAMRFTIAPILWVGAVAVVVALIWIVDGLVGTSGRLSGRVMQIVLALVAVASLAGLARARLARAAVADLIIGLGDSPAPGELQIALGRVLHDPLLNVAYWLPDEERFVDARGKSMDLDATEGKAVTMVEREGRRIAALVHDPAALEDTQLVESVCAAAALQLENERLQAELLAHLEEVEASRARIVEAAQWERRRIERDLHDGTQQRLVSIAMSLGLLHSKLSTDPATAVKLLEDSRKQLSDTLAELRDLSQGIHPGILTERGLPAALDELTQRVDMSVSLDVSLTERLPARVEEAAYFVVSEALTNVIKHANATHARVDLEHLDGGALLRVCDDGQGGADPTRGSGLRGLRDRVEALGGRLTVTSSDAEGTVLEARIPCGS